MTFTISQFIFICFLILIIYYINKKRNVLFDPVLLILFIAMGIFSVLFPGLVSNVANLIGIGRGTDLIFYLFMLGGIFAFIYILVEINKIKIILTKIVRNQSIVDSKKEKSRIDNGK